jgi:uncharacterized protein (TIGR00369 family)
MSDSFDFVHAEFARNGFMGFIGARLHIPAAGKAEVRVAFRPELSQQNGYFHGAMSGALADVACGLAALTLFPAGSNMLAVEYTIHFLEPALGDELVARGEVIRKGNRLTSCRCDLFVVKDGQERLCGAVLETVTGRSPAI